jgi:putative intracellular protease/amidase
MSTVYLYVLDTMADWEVGYLTAELKSGRYGKKDQPATQVVTVGLDKKPITTMGGLRVLPDISLQECRMTTGDTLLLPGGDTWLTPIHVPILELAGQCLQQGIRVAAICGATMGLAQAGLLNGSRNHTSNDREYLLMVCPQYNGEAHYQEQPVVTDGNLITASGIAPLEFAAHVLKALDVFAPDTLDAWYNLYKTQDSRYFYELMNAMS